MAEKNHDKIIQIYKPLETEHKHLNTLWYKFDLIMAYIVWKIIIYTIYDFGKPTKLSHLRNTDLSIEATMVLSY